MKILYIGNFRPPHSTENHIRGTLLDMGHEVRSIQEGRYTAQQITSIMDGWDILLWTRTWGVPGDSLSMLEAAKEKGIVSVAYHLDLYAGLKRAATIAKEPWWRCQYVFTADGGSPDFWKKNQVNHVWIPPGVYGPETYIADVEGFKHDVVFVGQSTYHKEWAYRQRLIYWLHITYGERFRRIGPPLPAVRGDNLNELYASTKVVVGDACCLGFNHEKYWSDRVPETLGRGGFLIHPWIKGLDTYFTDGKDLVYYKYNDFKGLKRQIDYYLEHDDERESIRRTGHTKVKRTATYRHHMESMLNTINERNRSNATV